MVFFVQALTKAYESLTPAHSKDPSAAADSKCLNEESGLCVEYVTLEEVRPRKLELNRNTVLDTDRCPTMAIFHPYEPLLVATDNDVVSVYNYKESVR